MGCCLALRIPPASESPTSPGVEDSQNFGDLAMVELRQAVAGRIKTLEFYRTDPNLDPLRSRDDFQGAPHGLRFSRRPVRA